MTGKPSLQIDIRSSILEASLEQVVRTLQPERALIAVRREEPSEPLRIAAQRGFVGRVDLDTADISTSTIQEVFQAGVSSDGSNAQAPRDHGPTISMNLAGLRSVLCAPIIHSRAGVIGVLYADDKRVVGAYGQKHLDWLTRIGKALGANADCRPAEISQPSKARSSGKELWSEYRGHAWTARQGKRLEEAESWLKRALACCREESLGGLAYCRTLNDLGEIYRLQERHRSAERLIQEAIRVGLAEKLDFHHTIPFFNNLGGLYFGLGRGEEAESVYRGVLQRVNWNREQESVAAVAVLCNLGTLCLNDSRLREALRYFDRATRIAAKKWGADNPTTERCRAKFQECKKLSA